MESEKSTGWFFFYCKYDKNKADELIFSLTVQSALDANWRSANKQRADFLNCVFSQALSEEKGRRSWQKNCFSYF